MNRKNISSLFSSLKENKYPEIHNQLQQSDIEFVPENLSWQLILADEKFRFIGKTEIFGPYAHLINISFIEFIKLIKQPFLQTHIDLLQYILTIYPNQKNLIQNPITFETLLPLKLAKEGYYYVKQSITPLRINNAMYGLQFVNIPIKKYNNEAYKIEVLFNYKKDEHLSKSIIEKLATPNIFTKQEIKNLENIRKKLSAEEIATLQNKTKAAVYKLNRKILEKISLFFDIEFTTVSEATQFFYECFPQTKNQNSN